MLRHQLKIAIDAFWSPSRAVRNAAEAGGLWGVQVLVLGMQMVSTALATRFLFAVAMNTIPAAGRNPGAASIASIITLGGYLSLAAAVLLQIVFWHVTAVLLQSLNILLTPTLLGYRKLLSLAIVGSLFGNLAPFHLVLVWYIRGSESFASIRETEVPIGLNLLPIEMPSPLWHLLGQFNLYQMCGVVYVAYGFAQLTGLRRSLSFAVIGGSWIGWQCIGATMGL